MAHLLSLMGTSPSYPSQLGSPSSSRGSNAISNLNLLVVRLSFQEPIPQEPLTGSSQ